MEANMRLPPKPLIETLRRSLDVRHADALRIVEAGRTDRAELAKAVNSRNRREVRTTIIAWSLIGARWATRTPTRLQAWLPENSPERAELSRTTAETLRNVMYEEVRITTAGRSGRFEGRTADGTRVDASFRKRTREWTFQEHGIDGYLRNRALGGEEESVADKVNRACRLWSRPQTIYEATHAIPKLPPRRGQDGNEQPRTDRGAAQGRTGLLPEEHFPDELAPADCYYDQSSEWPEPETVRRRAESPALQDVINGCCRSWSTAPSTTELHAAFRTQNPTRRQVNLLRAWVIEANISQLVEAWAQEAYTVRQLVGAIHRTDCARTDGPRIRRRVRLINTWATY